MDISLSDSIAVGYLTYYTEHSGGHPVSVIYTQDINYDGLDEVFFAAFESQPTTPQLYDNTTVSIWGWENGIFQDITNIWLPDELNQVQGVGDIAFGDFDGNGWVDVFLSAYTDMDHPAHRYALMNNGFTFEIDDLGTALWDHAAYSYDINSDGYDDVFLTGYDTRSNFLGSPTGLVNISSGVGGSGLAIGDYLNNGTVTVIYSDSSRALGQLFSIQIEGDQIIHQWLSDLPDPRIDINSHDIRVRNLDFDLDGLLDVLIFSWQFPQLGWNSIESEIQFLKNLGNGKFIDVTDELLINYDHGGNVSYFPQIIDVNQDGLMDIFTSNRDWLPEYRSTSLLIQQSDGTFISLGSELLRDHIGGGAQAAIAKGPDGHYYLVKEGPWDFSTVSTAIYLSRINFSIDDVPPTIAITTSDSNLTAGETATITFTLSESSTNFVAGDVTVTGGTLSGFSGSGTTYTATFTPDISSTTNGVVSVSNSAFTDAAGNPNADGSDVNNQVTMAINTITSRATLSATNWSADYWQSALDNLNEDGFGLVIEEFNRQSENLTLIDYQISGNQIVGTLSDGGSIVINGQNFGSNSARYTDFTLSGPNYYIHIEGLLHPETLSGSYSYLDIRILDVGLQMWGQINTSEFGTTGSLTRLQINQGDFSYQIEGNLDASAFDTGLLVGDVSSITLSNGDESASASGGSWNAYELLNLEGTFTDFINYLSSGHDEITGSNKADLISAGPGSDIIDGGSGIDTVTYSLSRTDYEIGVSGSGYTVHALSGSEGLDTLVNVEKLQFDDMTVDLTMRAQAQTVTPLELQTLQELYVGFFNRVPEANGLSYWISEINEGATLRQVADQFYSAGVQFGVYSADMTEAQFITTVYANVLGRTGASAPDSSEIGYWQNWLHTGTNSKGAMVLQMLNDSHNFFTGDPVVGWVIDLLDNKAAVANYFAVEQGISYNTPEESIARGIEIAAAITPTDITDAITLIGIADEIF